MICPGCNQKMRCMNSRPTSERIIRTRRYLCESCGGVYHTVEILRETYSALSAQRLKEVMHGAVEGREV